MQNLIHIRNLTLAQSVKTLIVFSLLFGTGYLLWQYWPTIMLQSIKWQRVINEQLSELLYDAQTNPIATSIPLVGLSLLYGVLHSVGPGHGKVIVTTFLATHPSKVKHSLVLTILSAFMQAIVAIALVTALVFLFNNSMREVNGTAGEFISLSFLMMVVLGAMIIFRALKKLYSPASKIHKNGDDSAHCCGHNHIAGADQINSAATWQAYAGIIISIGIRPCTGAIMALLFANMVGMYWLGVISAFMMAVGTAVTTSTVAILTLSGKKIISRYLGHDDHNVSISNSLLQLVGGLLLVIIGLLLFNTASSGISPLLGN